MRPPILQLVCKEQVKNGRTNFKGSTSRFLLTNTQHAEILLYEYLVSTLRLYKEPQLSAEHVANFALFDNATREAWNRIIVPLLRSYPHLLAISGYAASPAYSVSYFPECHDSIRNARHPNWLNCSKRQSLERQVHIQKHTLLEIKTQSKFTVYLRI